MMNNSEPTMIKKGNQRLCKHLQISAKTTASGFKLFAVFMNKTCTRKFERE